MINDPYIVLGISRGATQEEIKHVYRSKVKKYHPDANPSDPYARDRMNEINEAYDMLTNPKKYQKYQQAFYEQQGYANHSSQSTQSGDQNTRSYSSQNTQSHSSQNTQSGNRSYSEQNTWRGYDTEEKYNSFLIFATEYVRNKRKIACSPAMLYARQVIESIVNNIGIMRGIQWDMSSEVDLRTKIDILYENKIITENSKNNYHSIRMTTNPFVHPEKAECARDTMKELEKIITKEYKIYLENYGGSGFEEVSSGLKKKLKKRDNAKRRYNNFCTAFVALLFLVLFLNRDVVVSTVLGSRFRGLMTDGGGFGAIWVALGILGVLKIVHKLLTRAKKWETRILIILVIGILLSFLFYRGDSKFREGVQNLEYKIYSLIAGEDKLAEKRILGSASYEGLVFSIDQLESRTINIAYKNGENAFSLGWIHASQVVAETTEGTYHASVREGGYEIAEGDDGLTSVRFRNMEGKLLAVTIEEVNELDSNRLPESSEDVRIEIKSFSDVGEIASQNDSDYAAAQMESETEPVQTNETNVASVNSDVSEVYTGEQGASASQTSHVDEVIQSAIDNYVAEFYNQPTIAVGERDKPSAALWCSSPGSATYSSDENVATVNEAGVVTGIAPGQAYIVIKGIGNMAECYLYTVQ